MLNFGFYLKDHTDVQYFIHRPKRLESPRAALIITNSAMQYTYVDQQVVNFERPDSNYLVQLRKDPTTVVFT